ncbi:uncharacterized protein DUF2156 [Actinocrispum wychmicini]|uniref:Uncharacterized protein DUF2156 n=2 Tax=Actinocrispum wychmicini TaxID=1213861 RepID=A0A4R2JRI6_9PSEU|nr:uncharacterized protein DUF2156 [Actinocrispum wychmicini]
MTSAMTAENAAIEAIRCYTHADNPSGYFAFNMGNSFFQLPDEAGVIIYRTVGRYLVQFGGPFAPPAACARLLAGFVDFAADQRRRIVAVQLQSGDVSPYLRLGFSVNQMGASYAVELASFTLQGTRFMRLRNKISRALRSGLEIHEAAYADWVSAIAEVDKLWLNSKGETVKPLEFLVGQLGGPYQSLRRLFVAERDGELIGYISYAPVFGSRHGWMHDLSRRIPEAPPGVMEAVNKAAIDTFMAEGVPWLHFGFTPFTSLHAPAFPGSSPGFHWLMKYLWERGADIYPAQTQYDYKEKWAPNAVLPEYVAFQGGQASLPALVHVFRACNAV